MNVFCLLLPLPFPASKKIVFLEYIVASGNADCALLFDGFSLQFNGFQSPNPKLHCRIFEGSPEGCALYFHAV